MRYATLLLIVLMLNLPGCGGSAEPRGEAIGQITFGGKPIPAGTLFFYAPGIGFGQETPIVDGRFSLTMADGGLPPGTYQLAVLPGVNEAVDDNGMVVLTHQKSIGLPPHASNPAVSGLTAEIQEGENRLTLELPRKPRR